MLRGAHFLLYSADPAADRAFFRDVLAFPFVDIGGGWLIFKLPASELAVHPAGGQSGERHAAHDMLPVVLYLMCDDLRSTIKRLDSAGIQCTEVEEEDWGIRTTVRMPSGGQIGLYQPTHVTALEL
jgi:predicted enzyme related to lactoylglutathione lyase